MHALQYFVACSLWTLLAVLPFTEGDDTPLGHVSTK